MTNLQNEELTNLAIQLQEAINKEIENSENISLMMPQNELTTQEVDIEIYGEIERALSGRVTVENVAYKIIASLKQKLKNNDDIVIVDFTLNKVELVQEKQEYYIMKFNVVK